MWHRPLGNHKTLQVFTVEVKGMRSYAPAHWESLLQPPNKLRKPYLCQLLGARFPASLESLSVTSVQSRQPLSTALAGCSRLSDLTLKMMGKVDLDIARLPALRCLDLDEYTELMHPVISTSLRVLKMPGDLELPVHAVQLRNLPNLSEIAVSDFFFEEFGWGIEAMARQLRGLTLLGCSSEGIGFLPHLTNLKSLTLDRWEDDAGAIVVPPPSVEFVQIGSGPAPLPTREYMGGSVGSDDEHEDLLQEWHNERSTIHLGLNGCTRLQSLEVVYLTLAPGSLRGLPLSLRDLSMSGTAVQEGELLNAPANLQTVSLLGCWMYSFAGVAEGQYRPVCSADLPYLPETTFVTAELLANDS